MKILPQPLTFMWDKGNIGKNLKKHHVTTTETEEMFMSGPFIVEDVMHSTSAEKRFQALGKTKANRRLFVAFTIRSNQIRVISVRKMSKKEEKIYERLEKTT